MKQLSQARAKRAITSLCKQFMALILTCVAPLVGQSVNPVGFGNFTYYSYSPAQTQPAAPPGSLFSLGFPLQSAGAVEQLAACNDYSKLPYAFYSFSGGIWTLVTGPVFRYFSNYESTIGNYPTPVTGIQGLQTQAIISGVIATNTDPSTQAFVQSTFYHQDACFLAGIEMGFEKILINPGNTTEQGTVYFYYGLNPNCFTVSGTSSCRDRVSGANVFGNSDKVGLIEPTGTNSVGRTDWLYQMYAVSATQFQIRIRDPVTFTDAVTPVTFTVDSFFLPSMTTIYNSTISGYITSTEQRVSPVGNITDSSGNPTLLTSYSISTLGALLTPSISKTFGAGTTPIAIGSSTSLSFTVTNPNSMVTITNVNFTDSLPSGLVVTTPNGVSGTCGGGTITAVAASSSIALSGATLVGLASCTFSANVTATSSGVKANSVTASSTETGPGVAYNISVTVLAQPTMTKTFGTPAMPIGNQASLSFTISNPNTSNAITGANFVDSLPSGLVVATPNGEFGTCGGGSITAVAGSSSVSLVGATINPSASCTFQVNVVGSSSGVKNNSVTVSSGNAGTGSAATASITIGSAPSVVKTFGSAFAILGASVSASIVVTNPNAALALTGVSFFDALPSGLIIATPSGATGTCGGGTLSASPGSNLIALTGGTLSASATCTLSVNVVGTSYGTKTNSLTASAAVLGTGNSSSTSMVIVQPPSIAKSFLDVSIPQNGVTTVTFTISNGNTTTGLSGVSFTDSLPSGLIVAPSSSTSNSCGGSVTATSSSSSISLSGGSLAGSATCVVTALVQGVSVGTLINSVTVNSSTAGGGNTTTASLAVNAVSALATSLSGRFSYPDTTAVNGQLAVRLTQNSVINSCTSPTQVVAFQPVTASIINGDIATFSLLPSPCMVSSLTTPSANASPAAGKGATVALTAPFDLQGHMVLHTGTGTLAGTVATIRFGQIYKIAPKCTIFLNSVAFGLSYESTTLFLNLKDSLPLTQSTSYTIDYICGLSPYQITVKNSKGVQLYQGTWLVPQSTSTVDTSTLDTK